MLDYNVPGGKLNRGLAVADILRVFKKGEVGPCSTGTSWKDLFFILLIRLVSLLYLRQADRTVQVNEEELFRANALGWCIEWVRAPQHSGIRASARSLCTTNHPFPLRAVN